jgi:hypothetical protein
MMAAKYAVLQYAKYAVLQYFAEPFIIKTKAELK